MPKLIGKPALYASGGQGFRSGEEGLHALSVLLDEHAKDLPSSARVRLLTSDRLAKCIPLAWQTALSSQAEYDHYAAACFEQNGMPLGADWLSRASYRHFEAPGIAYALPTQWLGQLTELLKAKGMTLAQVTPVSVAAYLAYRTPKASTSELLLLLEPGGITAQQYHAKQMCSLDGEPMGAGIEITLRRLLRRIGHESPSRIALWSANPASLELGVQALKTEMPATDVATLPTQHWS